MPPAPTHGRAISIQAKCFLREAILDPYCSCAKPRRPGTVYSVCFVDTDYLKVFGRSCYIAPVIFVFARICATSAPGETVDFSQWKHQTPAYVVDFAHADLVVSNHVGRGDGAEPCGLENAVSWCKLKGSGRGNIEGRR